MALGSASSNATQSCRVIAIAFAGIRLADAAAKRGEYAEALDLLLTLEATGYQLEPGYEYKRARWRLKVKGGRIGYSQWFG